MTAALWITWAILGLTLVVLPWLVAYIGVLNSDLARLARAVGTLHQGQLPPELAELIEHQQRRGGGES